MGFVHQAAADEDGVPEDERGCEMIAREEIGSGEYLDPKGRLFLRSGMPEYSFVEDLQEMEDELFDEIEKPPKWKQIMIDFSIYILCAGLIVLGLIL